MAVYSTAAWIWVVIFRKVLLLLCLRQYAVSKRPVGTGLLKVKPLQQPAKLPPVDLKRLLFRLRPFEIVFLKALLPQTEAVSIPIQYLQIVSPAIAENKQMP